jgi:small subunit ribosomal protein S1
MLRDALLKEPDARVHKQIREVRAASQRSAAAELNEGQIVDGVVMEITDRGAFIDVGGIDGLLHVTDIAWRAVKHPSEVLSIGQQVRVKIIKINR